MRLIYLIEKEFKQMIRNNFIPRLILVFPCIVMLLMPWAATLEIDNLKVAVVDVDRSTTSRQIIEQIKGSGYFIVTDVLSNYSESIEEIKKDKADLVLEIPFGYEKEKVRGERPSLLITANSVDGMKGGIGASYLQQAISQKNIDISTKYLYNQYLDYKVFMVPALMALLLIMLCGFLPALNVVSEKEIGTIEQMNVSPISKITFVLGKLIPYWIVGIVVLSICIILAKLIYAITPVGNIGLIYLSVVAFVLLISGLGLVISNYSSNMQQAMLVMWFCVLVFILLSGLFTPISSMPAWAQAITWINPLRFFVENMRMVYLKGSTINEISNNLIILGGYSLFLYLWAIRSYKRQ